MAYEIEKKDRYIEVRVSGETSVWEVLRIIHELHRQDPGKRLPDLWRVAAESQVPFVHLSTIAHAVISLLPRGAPGNRSAILAATAFQAAQLRMYEAEASILPFPVRVFVSEDEALAWLNGSPQATGGPDASAECAAAG